MIYLLRKIRAKLIKQKKIASYVAYAIGEILLVVIGIYIAVEFNNSNQDRQNQKITQNNILLLIEGLKADSLYYNTVIIRIDQDLKLLLSFKDRLSSPQANLDTLIQIARHEFRPGIARSGQVNNDAYNAMSQSGEINLFERDLRLKIFSHYNQQKILAESDDNHFNSYLENMQDFNSKYGLQFTSPYGNGPIAAAIWENVKLEELAVAFHPILNSKLNHYNQTRRRLIPIIESTNQLLLSLKEAVND